MLVVVMQKSYSVHWHFNQSWSSNEIARIANTSRKQIYLNNKVPLLYLKIKNLVKLTLI